MGRIIGVFLVLLASCGFGQVAKTDSMPFTVDLSCSKYKLTSSIFGKAFFYNINGGKPNDSVFENNFMVATMDTIIPDNSFEARKAYLQKLSKEYKADNPYIPVEEKEIKINNEKAYEICYMDSIEPKPFKAYQVIFGNANATFIFYGVAVTNSDKTIEEFRKIAKTIKIK